MKQLSSKERILFVVVCFLLFLFGCVQHLNVIEFVKQPFSFGDPGDGLFNLWLLQKGYLKFFSGYLSKFSSGGIFWPKGEYSYFWSDNLLVYLPFYGMYYFISQNPYISYAALTYTVILAAFLSSLLFFNSLYTISDEKSSHSQTKWHIFLIPIFSYFLVFAESKLRYLHHWQNLSYYWIILMTACFLFISCTTTSFAKKSRYFQLIVISQVCLLYSTPYFAVIGNILLITWLLIQLKIDKTILFNLIKDRFITVFIGLGSFIFLAWFYLKSPKVSHSYWYIYGNGMNWWHLFIPKSGWAHDVFSRFFPLPEVNHEICAYLGLGLILSCTALLSSNINHLKNNFLSLIKQKMFWIILILFCIMRTYRQIDIDVGGYIGFIFISTSLVWLFSVLFKKEYALEKRSLSILFFFLLLIYGIASGPGRMFMLSNFNVSLWGFLKIFFSPLENMRAVGRIAGIGQSLLLGLTFLLLLGKIKSQINSSGPSKYLWHGLLLTIIIFQFVDPLGTQAYFHRYNLNYLQANSKEKSWLKTVKGSMIVFPSNPFHLNTIPMHYFNEFPQIDLLNGYSSHSTPEWDHIMKLGSNSAEPNNPQLKYAAEMGADYAVIFKWRLSKVHLENLKKESFARAFENSRLIILNIKHLRNSETALLFKNL